MNIEWNSIEVRGDYPLPWNQAGWTYTWTASEELIIEKAHQKMVDRIQKEKMSPRERCWQAWFGPGPIDRMPLIGFFAQTFAPRVLDAFADPPPVITNKDVVNFPNLSFITRMLAAVRFPFDAEHDLPVSFAEDLLTRKFRLIEYGPPLAVEPFAKTKEDLEWYLENMPDPALRGVWPNTVWTTKQRLKHMGEFVITGGACPGNFSSAGILRGMREFVLDVRKNPEMARLTFECATNLLHRRLEILAELVGPQLDSNGQGNLLWWCDGGGGYLNPEEVKKTWDWHWGRSIPHMARKGYSPIIGPAAPEKTDMMIGECMQELEGGGLCVSEETTVPVAFRVAEKYPKVFIWWCPAGKTMLNGPDSVIRRDIEKVFTHAAKHTKGLRAAISWGGGSLDAQCPISNLDYGWKCIHEFNKYPLTEGGM